MNHLSDDTLNELLDEALLPARREQALGHLADCPICTARLDVLRALFADLDSLPELTLEVDLTPLVLARLEQPARLPRPLRWLAWAQGLAALLALALAWPRLAALAPSLELPSLVFSWVEFAARLSAVWLDIVSRLPSPSLEIPSIGLDLPAAALTLALVSVSLLWLVGNAFLLIPHSRRTL